MFEQLLEKCLESLKESEVASPSGIQALYKVYHDVERNIDPDPVDIYTALYMMRDYYKEYLDWYSHNSVRITRDLPIHKAYIKRLSEIEIALDSGDPRESLVALDTAINQWHKDFPVIRHLSFEVEDNRLEDLLDSVAEILTRLGRLPKESPFEDVYV